MPESPSLPSVLFGVAFLFVALPIAFWLLVDDDRCERCRRPIGRRLVRRARRARPVLCPVCAGAG